MNLLEETISSMGMIRKTPNDVKFVSFMDDDYEIYQISFSSFAKHANIELSEVNDTITIVFNDNTFMKRINSGWEYYNYNLFFGFNIPPHYNFNKIN